MKPHVIVLCTVLAGQLLLAFQLRSWRALFDMLMMDVVLVVCWMFLVITLA